MTQLLPEDSSLIYFLKRYRPIPPPGATDLERQIMATVENPETVFREFNTIHGVGRCHLNALRIAIALTAGVLTAWIGYGVFRPSQLSLSEQQQLEDFIVSNWEEVMTGANESEWLEVQDAWTD
ncbi:MAG: hypothetical protein ACRC8A_00820 [Microcoleaceae cyanobacterium]